MATWRVSEKSLRPALWGGGGRGVMLFPPLFTRNLVCLPLTLGFWGVGCSGGSYTHPQPQWSRKGAGSN